MKRRIAMIISASLLVLSLSACGDVSVKTIFDEEDEKADRLEASDDEEKESEEDDEEGIKKSETREQETKDSETHTSEYGTDTKDNSSKSIEVEGSSNQQEATPIDVGQEIDGTVSSIQWFSFTTGNEANLKYQIIITNKTASSNRLTAQVKEISGKDLASVYAYSDGASASMDLSKLEPDTTYDISISPSNEETVDFHMVVLDLTETSD